MILYTSNYFLILVPNIFHLIIKISLIIITHLITIITINTIIMETLIIITTTYHTTFKIMGMIIDMVMIDIIVIH